MLKELVPTGEVVVSLVALITLVLRLAHGQAWRIAVHTRTMHAIVRFSRRNKQE